MLVKSDVRVDLLFGHLDRIKLFFVVIIGNWKRHTNISSGSEVHLILNGLVHSCKVFHFSLLTLIDKRMLQILLIDAVYENRFVVLTLIHFSLQIELLDLLTTLIHFLLHRPTLSHANLGLALAPLPDRTLLNLLLHLETLAFVVFLTGSYAHQLFISLIFLDIVVVSVLIPRFLILLLPVAPLECVLLKHFQVVLLFLLIAPL